MKQQANADGSFGTLGANVDVRIPGTTVMSIVLGVLVIFAGFFLMKKYIH